MAEALADPYARRVMAVCVRKARAVKEVSHETGLPLPTTYRQVNKLVELGLMVVERSALTPDGKKYDLYRSRVRAARIEMDAAGERVSWEPNEAVEERLAGLWDSLRSQAGR
ncbi:MAG TPA: helix-turn-helix domain-containing protein [Candidatus Thermoplasmatota archaeon]|nr:helix-turn-helix domain-containing protein [Candidatus Thermoplasmatota archaeon]